MQLFKALLYFGAPVQRRFFFVAGVYLMLLKYGIEASVIAAMTGLFYSPLMFAIPSFTLREPIFAQMPEWFSWAHILFSLPFLWIAVNLSVRRSLDALQSPWLGLSVLFPVINWFIICILCLLPTATRKYSPAKKEGDAKETDGNPYDSSDRDEPESSGLAATVAIGYGTVLSLILTLLSVFLINSYGAALFLGMPVIVGMIAAYKFNLPKRRRFSSSIGVSLSAMVFACLGMLLFAIEGVICLLMAWPLLIPVSALGGVLGYSLANVGRQPFKSIYAPVFILPLAMWAESNVVDSQILEPRVVESSVIVDASADEIWQKVVAFPEIAEAPGGYFDFGIAYPIRARIDGAGVGATRYCEFTTGSFVEPITVWNPPFHLGFDVSEQPDPMTELSPYRHVHPPHLEGSFESVRGEFRLVELADGRTRLEGRTWYRLNIGPEWYWRLMTEKIVHDIHLHVLNHIKKECER